MVSVTIWSHYLRDKNPGHLPHMRLGGMHLSSGHSGEWEKTSASAGNSIPDVQSITVLTELSRRRYMKRELKQISKGHNFVFHI